MDRILSLVCIITMMSSAHSQGSPWLGALEDSIDNDQVVSSGRASAASGSLKLTIPEECRQKGFCTNVPNFPVKLVEKIVADLGAEANNLQKDTLDESPQVVQRTGNAGDNDIKLCSATTGIIAPQAAEDKAGNWYAVVNLPNKPLQQFLVEQCDFTSSTHCSQLVTFPVGSKNSCVQQYVYRLMAAIDSQNKRVWVPLKLPSCCSCKITSS